MRWLGGVVGGLAATVLAALPAQSAQRISAQLGPLQPSVAIADLERFAETGELSPGLQPFAPLLTPEVRQALSSTLPLEPDVGEKIVTDLINSAAGERFMTVIRRTVPNSTPKKIQVALKTAAAKPGGLNLLNFMRAFPDEQIVIDLPAAIALGSQLNLPYWQGQALGSKLEEELALPESTPFYSSLDPTAPGPRWVRQMSLILRDFDRHRSIPVDLYWSRRGKGPVVVLSHGFGADRRFLSYLAYHLASHGFTVAAIEHPASNVAWLTRITSGRLRDDRMGDILPASEFIDRPKDISFLLNELDRMERRSELLRGRLNTRQVTVIGHSLGGYTALALAGGRLNLKGLREFCHSPSPVGLTAADWLQCTASDLPDQLPDLKDDRVRQIIALNPVMGHLFDHTSLEQIRIPTLVLSSTRDTITPAVSQQLLPFTHLTMPQRYLVTAIGATHLSVGDPSNLNQALTQSLFVRERRGDETEAVRTVLRGLSLAFVQQLTRNAERYQPFLTPEYVQSFSSEDLQLRLSHHLSDKLVTWLQRTVLPLEKVASAAPLPPTMYLGAAEVNLSWLMSGLPLVMFILPGNLPLTAVRFLRKRRRPIA